MTAIHFTSILITELRDPGGKGLVRFVPATFVRFCLVKQVLESRQVEYTSTPVQATHFPLALLTNGSYGSAHS